MKKLTQFEMGYVCALANLIAGHGANTEAVDVWKCMSDLSSARLRASGCGDFDIEQIEKVERYDQP